MATTAAPSAASVPKKQKYVRAVGPRLRILLYIVFALVALLAANSLYLISITALEAWTRQTYQDYFYQLMFLLHLALGLLLVLPFVAFGLIHMVTAWNRKNKRAIRIGYALLVAGLIVLVTGILLVRLPGLAELKHQLTRQAVYWAHVVVPLAAGWLYWLHRLAGPKIKWRVGITYSAAVGAVVLAMVVVKLQDPRGWNRPGSKEGEQYFRPSLALTSDGKFIEADVLMMDSYCLKCHADVYAGWFHSAHHFSSFNNPAYLASVRETRKVALERDKNVKASRWCAGCHDPVPFFSGAFDNPDYDIVNDPTAHAGITCTVCHAITHVNSTRGNADYVIEEPIHYPFAQSTNPILQFINNQLVKAKPSFHKQTFLKPFHRGEKQSEFCSTCHKVHLPKELNHYREFLRGQNHYDPFLLSGFGHGAQSFYYPPKARKNCGECHMPLAESRDFGAKDFDGSGKLKVHDHLFPAANTAIAFFKTPPPNDETHRPYLGEVPKGFTPDFATALKKQQEFLKDIVRVDLFGIREEGSIRGKLHAPLRPSVPTLVKGERYLIETVIRTLKLGHTFTQGTADSNEVWLDVTVKAGDRVIGRSGGIDAKGETDRWSHFVNVFMLDRNGNRINRRNPQDIFVPLYNHQIPPGAGQVVHYELTVPPDVYAPITIEVKLQYRKFDQEYVDFFTKEAKPGDHPIPGYTPGQPYVNPLPITTLAADRVTLPMEGVDVAVENPPSPIAETWQRWNDFGIGLLLEGKKGELLQAEEAFLEVEKLGRFDGPLNLARVYQLEGRVDEAVDALNRAAASKDPNLPIWTVNWLRGLVNVQQGNLDDAIQNFKSVLGDRTPLMIERGFDFSKDYRVINDLGMALFERSKQFRGEESSQQRRLLMEEAVAAFQRTLALDSEDVAAHHNLHLLYAELGDEESAEKHRLLHARYKLNDNAGDFAIAAARQKYPAANRAAEAVVIYSLQRAGAPGLPEGVAISLGKLKTSVAGSHDKPAARPSAPAATVLEESQRGQ
jgi:tetratricopeptide (TPR) repeat protein